MKNGIEVPGGAFWVDAFEDGGGTLAGGPMPTSLDLKNGFIRRIWGPIVFEY